MIVYNFKGKALWLTAIQGIFIVVLSEIVCLPFTINFDEIPTGIEFAVSHTPFYQLAVLWGLPISMVTSFLCFLIAGYCRNKDKKNNSVIKKKPSAICNFMDFLKDSDLFVLTIGLCAIGLILLPEIIYVKDIYSGDYKRANTMFKLTYQAYILFGICFGYLFVRLLRFGETIWQRVSTIFGLFFFTMTLFYAGNAVKAWYGDVFDRTGYKGIDAEAFMETTMPDDYLAINWLKDNVSGIPVVLEANGDSYSDYERVSVMTGLPTVLGWRTHEWLWKSDTTLLEERESDIQTIYTSYIDEEVKSLIQKYKIQYIYVGKLEQEKFENVNHDLIKNLGDIVFLSPVTEEKAYETYIVQIMN
jgi:YYY domain-containing protein